MSPAVGDTGLFGGDDGLGGYMPLSVVADDGNGAAQLSWVHGNHMGVPAVYTDASGSEIAMPAGYSAPGFPGQSRTFADLYYNRYRDYDPVTGRYIQADPIGLAGGPSLYSYAMNNPLRLMDPFGLKTYWEHYTGLPDSYRVNTINFIAGVSDGATFGATHWIRGLIGANDEVYECSPFYEGGEWASLGLGGGRLVYAGGSKILAVTAKDGAQAVTRRNAIKRVARGHGALSNYRIKSYPALRKKYGSDDAVKAAAGRTNRSVNAIGAAVTVSGVSAVSNNND